MFDRCSYHLYILFYWQVQYLHLENKTPKESFAVCVKPLHFEYNNVNQIIEFIELNRIIGVEHFALYNDSIGPQVSCVLKNYIENNIVTLLPWKLELKSQEEIRTEGLFAALNDCLYRYMYRFKYVLMIDLDEFIIPNYNETLPDLIKFLNTKADKKKIGEYMSIYEYI